MRKNVTRNVPARYKDVFKGDRRVAQDPVDGGDDLRLERDLHLRAEPALLRGMKMEPEPGEDIDESRRRRPVPGRFDHHRPHLARRLDQGGQPGR
jgi:hypothetical protein